MTNSIVMMPLCELIEDMEVYPRHAIDDTNVQALALALEAGAELPPIVAEKKSKRIVDGWHRGRAYKRVYGVQASVPVELRTYTTEGDLVADAVALNAAHGRRMDTMDQTRAVLMMEKHGVSAERIAMVLHVPATRVEKLRVRVAQAKVVTDATVPGTKIITLKRSVSHMKGEVLTRSQAEAHDLMPGTSFLLIAKQLRVALTEKLVNSRDERLIGELKSLREVLDSWLTESA